MSRLAGALVLAVTAALLLPCLAAARPPDVAVLVFDEFPSDSLFGDGGRVDRVRYPGFAALARGATWYPNATTIYDRTSKAVPAILEGRSRWRPGGSGQDVLRLLRRRRYSVRALLSYNPLQRYCQERGCRAVDLYTALDHRVALARREIRSIRRRRRPTLWLQHWLLPHGLWLYLPSGRRYDAPPAGPLVLLHSPYGFHDPFLTGHLHQRHLLQVGFVDRLVRSLVRRLKRTGMWNRTLLIVTADHGMSFQLGTDDRRKATRRNIHEVAPVPLFIKYPGQRRGRIDRSLVRTTDLLPTIAHVLRFRVPRGVTGRPASSGAVRGRRRIVFFTRSGARLRISRRSLARRRRASVRRRLQRFGTGSWARLYRWDSPPRLLGTSPRGIAPPSGGVRAVVGTGPGKRRLSRGSEIWPTLVSGTIEGGGGELRRLAVAVNGRIRAVGRSFRLRGQRPELYALIVPETAVRPGRNTLELFEVGGDGRLRRLPLTR